MAERKLGNWLQGYREFTDGTESPPIFHLWVGLGVISAAAQRKLYLEMDYFKVHSNQYIILVSPPGRSRKSTALRIGKNMLKGLVDYGMESHFSTQATSVAALIQQFVQIAKTNKEHQSLTSFSSELGSLLGTKPAEMNDFLTDIYDCEPDWDKQTVARSLEKIPFPWFNLLAATTPQWLGDNLSKTAVEGGFVSRCVFVYEDTRLLVAFPHLTDEQRTIRKYLLHDLAMISKVKGEFQLKPDAREFYKNWYENQAGAENDSRLTGYFDRKHIHVLKVAMALSLASNDSLMLEVRDIESAIQSLETIEPGMKRAFIAVGKNTNSTTMQNILQRIRARGGMSFGEIVADNIGNADRKTILDLCDSLVLQGLIKTSPEMQRITDSTVSKTTRFVVGTGLTKP